MEAPTGTIGGALIGAMTGLAAVIFNRWRGDRLDWPKWQRELDDKFNADLRSAVQSLVTDLAAAAQESLHVAAHERQRDANASRGGSISLRQ